MKIQYQDNRITIFESALFRATSSIVHLDSCLLLIDPNWLPDEVKFIHNYIETNYLGAEVFLLFTHADFDHILGYGAFPYAKVIAGKDFVDNPLRENVMLQMKDFDDTYYIERSYPLSYPKVDFVISNEGQSLVLGDVVIEFYSARGHVNNGLIAVCPQYDICIAGDYLSNIEIPMVEFSFVEYHKTLYRFDQIIKKYSIKRLVTGHGDIALSEKEIFNRLHLDTAYIHAFLNAFYAENPIFQKTIESKAFYKQNEIIHKNNINFLNSEVFL